MSPEVDAQHQTLEDMHALGHEGLEWDDLNSMDPEQLLDIMGLCEADGDYIDAENCVPCRVAVILAGPQQVAENEAQAEPVSPTAPGSLDASGLLNRIDAVRRDVTLLLGTAQGDRTVGEISVSQEDIALLVVAASRYTDQQAVLGATGFLLTPEEIQNVAEVRAIVQRIRQEA